MTYLRKVFLCVFFWMTLTILSVALVDPFGVSPLRISIDGHNRLKPMRLDRDRQIKPIEVWQRQPKSLFMGTSRIHQAIDPITMAGTKYGPAYNASVPGGELGELVESIRLYLWLAPSIEHIFSKDSFTSLRERNMSRSRSRFMRALPNKPYRYF